MGKRLSICLLVSIFLFFIPLKESQPMAIANDRYLRLSNQLNELIKSHPSLQGTTTGLSIRNASTGEIIYTFNGDLRLTPASNMKLFTASAALITLGTEYKFKTEIRSDGSIKNDQLNGNLYLVGKGDPTLITKDMNHFASEIKKKGINKIKGKLIGDDSWYDQIHYSIDQPWSDETAYYGAPISALTVSPDKDYDTGSVIIEISPGNKLKSKAKIKVKPYTDYVQIINETITVDSEGENNLLIIREHGRNVIRISGTIPITESEQKEWIAVWEPTKYVMSLFKQALEREGIEVDGAINIGITPKQTKLIYEHQSIPLAEILIPFMKLSNNGHAEVLVKEMGKRVRGKGSWEDGLKIEKEALTKTGVQPTNIQLRDGSGISHINAVPANEITQLLYSVQKFDWFPSFFESLPKSGSGDKMVAGTLHNRMKNESLKNKVIAKTGTLTNVSSLSGYIETKGGELLLFSILLNHLKDEKEGKQVEDQIVNILANFE